MTGKIKPRRKNYWKNCVLYAFVIVILSNATNYAFGLGSVREFFIDKIQFLTLDLLFYDFLYYTEPYLHLERLAFLKDWLWLLPYIVFSVMTGALHPFIYEKRLDFKHILLTSTLASVFQLFSYSLPYGVYPVFIFFIDFVKKFCLEPALILPACFLSLFFGTEFIVIWIKNAGAEEMMDRYR